MNSWEDISNKTWRQGFSDGVAAIIVGELLIVLVILIVIMAQLWWAA